MRRAVLIVFTCALVAGCGSKGITSPAPRTVIGALPKAQLEPITAAFKLKGDPSAGKAIFLKAGCTGCHTLADAHATGTVGPNLDQAKPAASLVFLRVTQGAGAMPSFKGQLSQKQIGDVIAYVVKASGGNPNG